LVGGGVVGAAVFGGGVGVTAGVVVTRGVAAGVRVGVADGEGDGDGRGVTVNDGSGRGVNVTLGSGVISGVGDGALPPRRAGTSERPAPATIAAPSATTSRMATALPTAVEVDRRTMTVCSRGRSIGSVGSLIRSMLAPR
jgi:hypothetical protein